VREGGWVLLNLWALTRATGGEVRRRPWLAGAMLVLVVAAGVVGGAWDSTADAWARANDRPGDPWQRFALSIRTFGAFTDVLTWTGLLLVLGRILGRERWRKLGIACLCAASLAGLAANLVRPTLGRARPDTDAGVWAVRGPVLSARWQSLPSGHTATSVGGGAALAALGSPLGILAVAQGGLVAWASVRLDRHWVSDVAAGLGLGLGVGVLVALAWRRLEREGGWVAAP